MRVRPDPTSALEFCEWIRSRQPEGLFLLCAMDAAKNTISRQFFDNRDPNFTSQVSRWLAKYCNEKTHIFYSVNAFVIPKAKAENIQRSRIAHVDADGVGLPPNGPSPTRIVRTSPQNSQFFYELREFVTREEIHAISKGLTALVRGDPGGHSPAKLMRLPGTINPKPEYHPSPVVELLTTDGPIHHASALLFGVAPANRQVPTLQDVEKDARAIDPQAVLNRLRRYLPPEMRLRISQRKPYGGWTLVAGGRRISAVPDDRSAIIFQIGRVLRRAGASPAEVLAVVQSTCFWRSRIEDGKFESAPRLIGKIFKEVDGTALAIDPADWADEPVPIREWLVPDLVPMGKVTALYGDGGTGKTLLATQLAVSTALGIAFVGRPARKGRVYAFLAENEKADTHIHLDAVCRKYDVPLEQLRGHLLVASRAGLDNVLMDFSGTANRTELFKNLLLEITSFRPTLVILETAADLFGGNENDRGQVRRFVSECLTRIAIVTGAAVVLCAHPSVSGIRSGEGSGGSTAWNNAVRSRLYLRRVINDRDEEADPDIRVLEVKKANLAQRGTSIALRWQHGVFVEDQTEFRVGDENAIRRAREITEAVANRYTSSRPFSAHVQSQDRWLGDWIINSFRMSRPATKRLIRELLDSGALVEVYEPHSHRKVLCTREQQPKSRAKQNRDEAMQ